MRIAYVTETYPPELNGVALTAQRAVRHLRAVGHEVHLVRPRQAGEDAALQAQEWRVAGMPIPMYPDLRIGWARPAALRRQWRERGIDLVHVATPGPLGWLALAAARAEGIPTSADFRTNFHAYSRYYRLGWLAPVVLAYLRQLHARADLNFVPTSALADELAARGFSGLRVVGRGVDTRHFDPARRDPALRREWGVGDAARVLLYVGRLAAEKNVERALLTCRQLQKERREQDPPLRMVVVGDGPLHDGLRRRYPEVHFSGPRRGADLARHYASADLFLFPSLTDTFGNVALEALASGLALVAFDLAAAAQHVEHGRSGVLVAPGDEAAFVDAARQALAQADPRSPLRRRAREAALRAHWNIPLHAFEQSLHQLASSGTKHWNSHAALA